MIRCLCLASLAIATGCGSVVDGTDREGLPTVATVEPATGGAPGGAMITLTGTNFQNGTTIVVVGNRKSPMVNVASSTMLTFELPPGDEGATVDVTVANDAGFGVKDDAFTYKYRPAVLGISPARGKGAGGTMITITGRGFADAGETSITIAGGRATNVTVVSDQMITAMTAAVATGTKPFTPIDVSVENDNGVGTLTGTYSVTSKGLIVIDQSRRLFHVDINDTKTVTQLSNTARRLHGCALNPTNNLIYAVGRNPTTNVHELVTVDLFTGAVTVVGPLNEGATARCVSSLTFIGGTLYGVNSPNNCGVSMAVAPSNRIATINTMTAAVTLVGTNPMPIIRPNAIALKDAATLFFADNTSQSLDTIAVSTSVLTTGQPITGGTSNAGVHGMVMIGGTLYLIERTSPASIYTVNQTTGAMARQVTVQTSGAAVGLCETPASF